MPSGERRSIFDPMSGTPNPTSCAKLNIAVVDTCDPNARGVPWTYEVSQLLRDKLHHSGQSVRHLDYKNFRMACLFLLCPQTSTTHDSSLFHRAFPGLLEKVGAICPPAHIHIMTGYRKSSYPFSPQCLIRVDSWKLPIPSLTLFEHTAFPMLSTAASSLPYSRTARKPT